MFTEATNSVITVGQGRGFVIDHDGKRLVVTAAHCLPYFPTAHAASYLEERTHLPLLSGLGRDPAVAAECLFADPIADLAVLGAPDRQELYDEAVAYDELTEAAVPAAIGSQPSENKNVPAWLLSLDNRWFRCEVLTVGGPLWVFHATESIVGGMSGSPILSNDGKAIGAVSIGSHTGGPSDVRDGGPNPSLPMNLPSWLVRPKAPVA